MIDRIRGLLGCMTRGERIALAVFTAVLLAWTVFVSASQEAGFKRYQEEMASQPEVVVLMTDKGPITVDKAEYDAENERWRAEHPEEYAVPGEGR